MDTNIFHDLANVQTITLRRLVMLTRDYYRMSQTDRPPQSHVNEWYYRLAHECERRGLSLDRIIK